MFIRNVVYFEFPELQMFLFQKLIRIPLKMMTLNIEEVEKIKHLVGLETEIRKNQHECNS